MATITVTPSQQDFSDYDAAQAKLTAAFALVEPSSHWKDPINALVPEGADLALIAEAIIHFTATVPSFEQVTVTTGLKSLPSFPMVRVQAAGYRQGPAGDK